MILHLYAPVSGSELPRGSAVVGLPDPANRVVAAIDTDGKRFLNRVTRAAIRYLRAPGAKTSLRRFHPEQLRLVATYDTERWSIADIVDFDSLEIWSNEYVARLLQSTSKPSDTSRITRAASR